MGFCFVIFHKNIEQASQVEVKVEAMSPGKRKKTKRNKWIVVEDSDSDDEIIPAKLLRKGNSPTIKEELQEEDEIVRQIAALRNIKKPKKTEDKQVKMFDNFNFIIQI